jgi:hypothetical protein
VLAEVTQRIAARPGFTVARRKARLPAGTGAFAGPGSIHAG